MSKKDFFLFKVLDMDLKNKFLALTKLNKTNAMTLFNKYMSDYVKENKDKM